MLSRPTFYAVVLLLWAATNTAFGSQLSPKPSFAGYTYFISLFAEGNSAFRGEFDFIRPSMPSLVICGEDGLAFVDVVKLATGRPATSCQLTVALDSGLIFTGQFSATGCPGIQSGVRYRSDLSSNLRLVFDFPDMDFIGCGTIRFSIGLRVDCSILRILDANPNEVFNFVYTMNYEGGSDTKEEIALPQIAKPQLTITNPGGKATAFGKIERRSFTICQTGVDAYLDDPIIIRDFGAKGIRVRGVSVNGGPEIAAYVSGTPGNQIITIPPSEFSRATLLGNNLPGNNNQKLDGPISGMPTSRPECLIITEIIEINSCQDLLSAIYAAWGCDSDTCGVSETVNPNFTIELSEGGPNIVIEGRGMDDLCVGTTVQREFTLRNIGNGVAKDVEVDVYIWSGAPTIISPCNGSSVDSNSILVSVNNGPFVRFVPIKNNLLSCPLSLCRETLFNTASTIVIPFVQPGDVLTIRYSRMSCCPVQEGYYFANGDAARARFLSSCDDFTATMPVVFSEQVYFSGGELVDESPTDVYDGQKFEYRYIYKELGFSLWDSLSEILVEIELPQGVSFSGDQRDIFWKDVYGRDWEIKRYNYDIANRRIQAYFSIAELYAMIFGRINSEIVVKNLVADCADFNRDRLIYLDSKLSLFFIAHPNCQCRILLNEKFTKQRLHCKEEPSLENCTGLRFLDHKIHRITYGLKDNDNDGAPDGNQIADPAVDPIKTVRVMPGDVILSRYKGVIKGLVNDSWKNLFLKATFPSASEMEVTSVRVKIYDSDRNAEIFCAGLPAVRTGDSWLVNAGQAALVQSACGDPDLVNFSGYAPGDSVEIEIHYRVDVNDPAAITENVFENDFFVTNLDSVGQEADKAKCDQFYGRINYYGYTKTIAGSSMFFNGCEDQFLQIAYDFYNMNTNQSAGTNLFPYEFRHLVNWEEIQVNIPNGYTYRSAEISLYNGIFGGAFDKRTVLIDPENPNSQSLVFRVDRLYRSQNPNGTWPDPDDAFKVELRIFLTPNCEAKALSPVDGLLKTRRFNHLLNIPADGNNTDERDDMVQTFNPSKNSLFQLQYTAPKIVLQSPNPIVNGVNANFKWTIIINNTALNTNTKNLWMHIGNPSGKVSIRGLQVANRLITPGRGGIYPLGDLRADGGELVVDVLVDRISNCLLDSVEILVGWNCTDYPTSLSDNICPTFPISLYVNPFSTDMNLRVVLPKEEIIPRVYSLCEDIEFVLQVDNVGQATASNIEFDLFIPEGLEYIPGSAYIEYRLVSNIPPAPNVNVGNWVRIDDPVFVATHPLGDRYRWHVTNLWKKATGNNSLGGVGGEFPPSVINPDSSKFYVRFLAQTNCGFRTARRIPFQVKGQSPCQIGTDDFVESIIGFSPPILIVDPASLYFGKLSTSADTLVFGACGAPNKMRIKFENFGPAATSPVDSIKILLPRGVNYVRGTTVGITNYVGGEPQTNMSNGKTTICWPLGSAVPAGQSVEFSFDLSLQSDQFDCQSLFNAMNILITTRDLICQDNGVACRTEIILAEAQYPIRTQKSNLRMKNQFTTCPESSGAVSTSLQLEIRDASVGAGQFLTLRIVEDQNRNGRLDSSEIRSAVLFTKSFAGPFQTGLHSFALDYVATNTQLKNAFIVVDGSCSCNGIVLPLGVAPCAAVGDYVWFDRDGNGIQNASEPPAPGVKVILFTELGTMVAMDTTDQNGLYLFEDLKPGRYYLRFVVDTAYQFTLAKQGSDESDSDVTNARGFGTTGIVVLQAGQTNRRVDAGIVKCEEIGDYVWYDSNTNGIQDPFERGVNNAVVELYKPSGQLVATTLTRRKPNSMQDGWYTFCAIPGEYYIKFVRPASIAQTKAKAGNDPTKDSDITNANGLYTTDLFRVIEGQPNYDIDGGFVPDACLGNLVWFDDNYNGLQDPHEPKVEGVSVQAIRRDGIIFDEVFTDVEGIYHLDGLPSDIFYLKFQPRIKYAFTRTLLHRDRELDSDVTGKFGYGTTDDFQTLAGVVDNGIDAGLLRFVLALQDLEIKGSFLGSHNLIEWKVNHGDRVNQYDLEKWVDELTGFASIHAVKDPRSLQSNRFQFEDNNIKKGTSYFYRIKQLLANGDVNHSQIIEVKTTVEENTVTIQPNPASEELYVMLALQRAGLAKFRVINVDGKNMDIPNRDAWLDKGLNALTLDIGHLVAGTYWLKIMTDADVHMIKFIKN